MDIFVIIIHHSNLPANSQLNIVVMQNILNSCRVATVV